MKSLIKLLALFYIITLFISPTLGWGARVHEVAAHLADDLLTETTKNKILKMTGGYDWWSYPLPAWSDQFVYEGGDWTKEHHFINVIPYNPDVNIERDCGEAGCVYLSIYNYTRLLMDEDLEQHDCSWMFESGSSKTSKTSQTTSTSTSQPDWSKEPCTLSFLIHYIGDLTQPFHVANTPDNGANGIKVWLEFLPEEKRRSTNLHHSWDSDMLYHWSKPNEDLYNSIKREYWTEENIAFWASEIDHHIDVAQESLDYSKEGKDGTRDIRYDEETGLGILDEEYHSKWAIPITAQRVAESAVHISVFLNAILDPKSSAYADSVQDNLSEMKPLLDKLDTLNKHKLNI